MKLNKDYKLRNKILGLPEDFDDICQFKGINPETLQELLDLKFADPSDNYNDCPTFGEFLDFMKAYPGYTAHGYATSHLRDDYRVTIEGLMKDGESTKEEIIDFVREFKFADEFEIEDDYVYCWYD